MLSGVEKLKQPFYFAIIFPKEVIINRKVEINIIKIQPESMSVEMTEKSVLELRQILPDKSLQIQLERHC